MATYSSSKEPSVYASVPLTGRAIRITLDPLPQGALDSHPLQGDLKIASLDADPSFMALSYVRGSFSSPADTISVGSSVLDVTPSCKQALIKIRRRFSGAKIWIDAICINQADNAERDAQVRLMGEIYSRAQPTIAWIGEASIDSGTAIDLVPILCKTLDGFQDFETITDETFLTKLNVPRESDCWKALGNLLARPWFQRVWVVQEAVLSQTVHVMCGDRTLGWKEFSLMIGVIYERRLLHLIRNPIRANVLTTGVSTSWYMQDVRKRLDKTSSKESLAAVLFGTMGFLATNSKDKVFGVLGLVGESEARALTCGYNDTVQGVYTNAVEISLSGDPNLDVLSLADLTHERSIPDLPSWVPDFSRDLDTNPFGMTSPGQTINFRAGIDATLKQQPSVKVSRKQLAAKANVVDTIVELGTVRVASNQAIVQGIHDTWYDWMQRALRMSEEDAFLRLADKTSQSLWRTLIANTAHPSKEPASTLYQSYFQSFRRLYLSRIDEQLSSSNWSQVHAQIMEDDSISTDAKSEANRYLFAFLDATIGRRLCLTESGRTGLVPAGVEKGDAICIILGAKVSYVIRAANCPGNASDAFQLVGDCYVDGIMAGEAVEVSRFQDLLFI